MSSDSPIPAAKIAENISKLKKSVSEAEDNLDRLRTELEWWEMGHNLYGESLDESAEELPLEPSPAEPEGDITHNGSKPTLRQAISTVLAQEPRKTWSTDAVIAELRRREWFPKGANGEHTVRSMLASMHGKGEARKMARGAYRLPPARKGT